MASQHHRHQISLEGVLDFSPQQPLISAGDQDRADAIFKRLVGVCEPIQKTSPYKKTTLVRETYERTQSKEIFLYHFFVLMDTDDSNDDKFIRGLSRLSDITSSAIISVKLKEAEKAVNTFAEYLISNFFLPLKASGGKTPQITPATLSRPVEDVVGTAERLSSLRRDCLIRDRHRCVVSRKFDGKVAEDRTKHGEAGQDDEGNPFVDDPSMYDSLENAHIIPFSVMSTEGTGKLVSLILNFHDFDAYRALADLTENDAKRTALAILRMFDPNIIPLIEGDNINRPTNAITLTHRLHMLFGDFRFYFDDTGKPTNTYLIDSLYTRPFLRPEGLPITRTLLLSPDRTIDPPSPRLLAIHRAICFILCLSGAGEYIEDIIRDMEEFGVRSDGSTELDKIVSLRLGGWYDGVTV